MKFHLRQGKDQKRCGHQKFVGQRIQHCSDRGLLSETSSNDAVQDIRDSCSDKCAERPPDFSVCEQADENRNKHDTQDRELVRCRKYGRAILFDSSRHSRLGVSRDDADRTDGASTVIWLRHPGDPCHPRLLLHLYRDLNVEDLSGAKTVILRAEEINKLARNFVITGPGGSNGHLDRRQVDVVLVLGFRIFRGRCEIGLFELNARSGSEFQVDRWCMVDRVTF